MKKFIFLVITTFTLIFSFSVKAFTLDEITDINIDIDTEYFSIDVTNYELVYYDDQILYLVDDTFYIVTPQTTRLILSDNNGNIDTITINFIEIEDTSLLTIELDDDAYYLAYDGTRLYGDYEFVISEDSVTLDYNGTTISYNLGLNISNLAYYLVIIIGTILVILIIIYAIYLLSPKNYTKKFNKCLNNLLKNIDSIKNPKKKYPLIKIKMTNFNNLFKSLDNNHPLYKDIKSELSNINLIIDNVTKLMNYQELIDYEAIINLIKDKLINIKNIVKDNSLSTENINLNKLKINLPTKQMNRTEEDGYRFLEGNNLIKKDCKK